MSTFEENYRAYHEQVYRFSFWLCGDSAEADDIAAETFLRLWTSHDDVRVETMKAYLLTIARNVFISRRRRSSRHGALPDEIVDIRPPPDVEAERKDQLSATLAAVQRLPEGERAALLLRTQNNCTYEEVARSLGVSVAAAKVRVHRARLKLAQWRDGGEQSS